MAVQPQGRVVQVSVSGGGVPKRAVERAWVNRLGLEGDAHRENTVHGGPHRAVCLFGIEVIERLQSEGHPVEPGSVGENLTTSGIEWSLLPIGTRARVGDQLELEVSSSTTPCATQVRNFSDGNFNRIRIELHPSDSRMYARVITEGEVHAGDPITILPDVNPRAAIEEMKRRLNRAEGKSTVAAWRAAAASGYAIDIVDDGEIALASSTDLPGPAFNSAHGLARLPNLMPMATDFYDRHNANGYLWLEEAPWPGAVPFMKGDLVGAYVTDDRVVRALADAAMPEGVTIRRLEQGEANVYSAVTSGNTSAGGIADGGPNPWPQVYERLAGTHARQLFVAEIDGVPVANASLHVSAATGWLRGALVTPAARGRGIQTALIATRMRAAIEAGCDLVGAQAEPGAVSVRNLLKMGMRRLGTQNNYEYVPGHTKP
ncbi:MAG TPA: GNAT family N-acetyltransferase [Candidatus Limnocylindria bacterium]|nr:GNAT family N-acetyltransferase [Candidatus Limnocylindria bacterium]